MERISENIKNFYFLGIGGIGMSALARYFHTKGYRVAGYDRTPSALTKKLEEEGIPVNYEDGEDKIEEVFRDPATTWVVYTPAVPEENCQYRYFLQQGFHLQKRSEVLGVLSRQGKALCIAGTHGKTTITTLLAYLLKHSAVGCNAFLGGISVNFETNLLLDRNSPYIVIEADEFDRSFLRLSPEMAAITAMDEDHLDIYGDREHLVEAFEAFAGKVRKGGKLFVRKGLQITSAEVTGYYAAGEEADYYALHPELQGTGMVFDYYGNGMEIKQLKLGIPGRMNVENAVVAITMALEAGVKPEEIRKALPDFRGVVRRFNIHTQGAVIFIDDYAHHPREIEAVLDSVRHMWPGKKLTVAFQPHLYSRTRDLQAGFAESLDKADEVILLDIYPARETAIPGVTSALIADKLKVPVRMVDKKSFLKFVEENVKEGIFVTMGAGDIDRFIPELKRIFETNTLR